MAIQYYMRAFNTSLSAYVDWVVNDTPDSTGAFSGYPTNQLIDITVNRVVQSKVANFLKQNQSLGGTDGYYFHVNSYDWRSGAVAPILPPTNPVGLAVERGLTSVVSITSASNATPIVINTSAPHGLATGAIVTIIGVTGNTAANGTWPIVVTGSSTFQLVGSAGNGASAVSGTVFVPTSFSTLTWDESQSLWRFVVNTNGDGTTLGASQNVKVNNFFIDGYLALGSPTASAGIIRLPNNQYIDGYNTSNGGNVQLIGVDTNNRVKLGLLSTDIVYTPGLVQIDGYIQHTASGVDGVNVPSIGFIRDQNNTTIVAFRNQLQNGDVAALGSNTLNQIILGDAVNGGTIHNTATGNVHQFQVNTSPQFEIGTAFARFTSNAAAPSILQVTPGAGISGVAMTVQAQNAGAGGATGGNLILTAGSGATNGTINLQTAGTTRVTIADTAETLSVTNLNFANTVTSPLISQITTAGASAQAMTVQAQNSSAGSGNGGNLVLTSGSGTSTNGQTLIQTAGTTQIIVSSTTIPPGSTSATTGSVIIRGNLEVVGTTTTVDSTVVDIIGRVIHSNWADPVASPNVAVPSQIVGYSVHRGNSSGLPRDGAAWIWTEGAQANGSDGYWRAQTDPGDGYGTDNFTASNSTTALNVMGNSFSPTPDPNPVTGTLPALGGVRIPNNLAALVARNVSPVTTIAAASNLASLPQATINVASTTGFTTAGTLLIFSDSGVQTVTYTGTSGGNQFTGASGGAGTIHTGAFVAQTNKSTTIAAGSNGAVLPQATINVTSTTGFPTSGTIRIVSSVSGANGAVLATQTISYTNTTGTTFTGCTGGTGTLLTGQSVTSPPIPGTADLVLASTDFGNRAVWGSPSNLNGHIFNTPTGTFYEMQVNSVDQVRIGQADPDADGYAEVIEIGPTITAPRIYQIARPDTGANAGTNMVLQAQNGQNQTGATTNNNGGNLVLASGAAGTGGTTATGVNGSVDIYSGLNTIKARFFPTFAANAADSNTLLIEESIVRIGPTQNVPLIRQDSTTSASGQSFTLQAQNAATRGGPLLLVSGTGTGTQDGYINLTTGGSIKVTIFPTTAVSAGDNNSILYFENLFRVDSAQTSPVFRQDTTGGASGQAYTIQAQNAATTGGNLVLTSGTGTTAGNVQLQTGAVDRLVVHPTFTEFRDTAEALRITPVSAGTTQITYASTVTAAQINQSQTSSTPSAPMTIQSQVTTAASGQGGTLSLIAGNASGTTSTGGALNLASGSGTSTNGVINFQPGGTTQFLISATGATIQWVSTVTSPVLNQVTTGGASGQALTVQAQNAATTGGNLVLTSGTGTTAGNVQLQTGAVDRLVVHPTFTEFRDTAEALRVTPVSAGTTTVQFASTVTAVSIRQADLTTNSGTGAATTVQAQNETGTTSVGGALNLTSGTGTSTNGAVNLQVGGTTTASLVTNKFVLNKGWRRNVVSVTAGLTIPDGYDYIAITSLTAPMTLTLPATPTTGDSFTIKDAVGNAATNNVTISGNGNNIDGASTAILSQNFSALVLTYTGTQWSIT